MAFFEDEELAALEIERMVFHLVAPQEDAFVRLEEMDPGKFAPFFLERIQSVNNGRPYLFSDASATRERLARISADMECFQVESEKLAEDFQRKHGGSTAAGAFLVFVLKSGNGRAFALLKYDDEQVLAYEVEEGEHGRKRVSLDALERTFVQNRDALQKSALIRLTEDGGELIVLDRRNQQNIARYFEAFLDAIRVHDDAELTEKLVQVTRDVLRKNKDMVPPEIYRELTRRTYEAAKAGGIVDADNQKAFLDAVMGAPLAEDHPLIPKFRSALRKARIDGAPVTLNPVKVRPPKVKRYETYSGIQVRVPQDVEAMVTIEANRIVINDGVANESDDTDKGS